ncbi:hypothetical protein [Nostoc sp. NMS8]|nr:hypothetical protein [Nostoc sp. NMS8]
MLQQYDCELVLLLRSEHHITVPTQMRYKIILPGVGAIHELPLRE